VCYALLGDPGNTGGDRERRDRVTARDGTYEVVSALLEKSLTALVKSFGF
jgi:hypothetical protein